MKLIWDSEEGCKDCQINHVKVYRPEAPDGYVCLGDYVKEGSSDINDDDYNKIISTVSTITSDYTYIPDPNNFLSLIKIKSLNPA